MIQLLLADEHNVVREALASALGAEPDFSLIVQAESAREALNAQQRHKFDVAVIELSLADRYGTELIRQIKAAGDTRVPVDPRWYDQRPHRIRMDWGWRGAG